MEQRNGRQSRVLQERDVRKNCRLNRQSRESAGWGEMEDSHLGGLTVSHVLATNKSASHFPQYLRGGSATTFVYEFSAIWIPYASAPLVFHHSNCTGMSSKVHQSESYPTLRAV